MPTKARTRTRGSTRPAPPAEAPVVVPTWATGPAATGVPLGVGEVLGVVDGEVLGVDPVVEPPLDEVPPVVPLDELPPDVVPVNDGVAPCCAVTALAADWLYRTNAAASRWPR